MEARWRTRGQAGPCNAGHGPARTGPQLLLDATCLTSSASSKGLAPTRPAGPHQAPRDDRPASQLCPGNGGHWYAPVPLNRSEVLKGGRLRSPLQQLRSARRHGLGKQLHQEPSILFFLTALPKGRASLHTQPGNTSAPKTAACQYVSSPTLTGTLCWQSSP